MWTRKELKAKARARLSANYWRMVLAFFIITLVTGGGVGISYKMNNKNINVKEIFSSDKSFNEKVQDFNQNSAETPEKYIGKIADFAEDTFKDKEESLRPVVATIIIVCVVIVLLIFLVSAGITIFLRNPLYVGGMGFFLSNAERDGEIGEFGLAFRKNYLQIVLGMMLRGLYIILWSLLFVIPGVIKAYEYRMVPYILADNPDIKQRDAFDLSKAMMRGNKWRAFVLDLSFIGWGLLSLLTLGLLTIFFVGPYEQQTNANLYLALRGEMEPEAAETVTYDNYMEMN